MKKNAAKANIKKNAGKAPTKETVDTPLSECQAENPLECRFHGLKALDQMLPAILGNNGYYGAAVTDKLQGNKGYEFRINGTFHMPNYFASHIAEAFEKMGYSCAYQGKVDGGGHSFIVKKAKGKKKPTLQPAEANNDEVDLLDDELADLDDIVKEGLKDKEAKSNHNPFDGIDITEEDIAKAKKEQEGDDGKITDADVKDFLTKQGSPLFDDLVETWVELANNGENKYGTKVAAIEDSIKQLISKAGADHKVSKALMKHLNEQGDGEITDEEMKDYLTKGGILFSGASDAENTISTWKNYATKGENKGHKIAIISGIVNALISKMGEDNKISKALQKQLDNVDGKTTKPTNETASDEEIDLSELDEIVKEKESENSPSFTDDELLDFVNKVGWYKSYEAKDEYTEEISKGTIKGQPLSQGHILALKNAVLKVPTHPISFAIVKTLNKLKSARPQEETEQESPFTDAELKDFMEKNSWPSFPKTYKEMILKGTMNGNPLHDSQIKALEKSVVTAPLHPVALAITKTLNKIPGWKGMPKKAGILDGGEATEDTMKGIVEEMVSNIEGAPNVTVSQVKEDFDGTHKYVTVMIDKPTGIGEIEEKDVFGVVASKVGKFGLLATQFVKGKYGKAQFHVELWPKKPDALKENANKGNTVSVDGVDESLMKPLEHDESKFPKKLTQAKLDEAIAHGKKAGGNGGLHTTVIEIDGKKYVCKSGSGKKSNIIHNGYNADMAYRAGGVYAPDAKLYEFGDGKTYKLSEFVGGKRLIDVWKTANDAKREEIRKELLKGFPLDVLFSNYDVLGTSPEEAQTVMITDPNGKEQKTHVAFDNIILGDDGHAYRIDNDGAFAMTGTGNHKTSGGASLTTPVNAEEWENWDERQWIDDFRTMRRNEKNLGIFDRYSTADIFLSASRVNFNEMEKFLADGKRDPLRKALLKPLFEMKQMAAYAHGAVTAGYKNMRGMEWTDAKGKKHRIESDPISMALDAIYNANKAGARKFLQKATSWVDTGWLSGMQKAAYVPSAFGKPEPQEPLPPPLGIDVAKEVLEGIKTIAYHVKQGDYEPNPSRIKRALAVKPFCEVLSTVGNNQAKGLLEAIGKIEKSIETGHKETLKFNTKDGLFDFQGLSLVVDEWNSALFAKETKPLHTKWEIEHKKWAKEKQAHDDAEAEKAKAAGAAPAESFQVFEDKLVDSNINTDGIAEGGGDHAINHESKDSQQSSSFQMKACLKKVRQYAMMGLSLDEMEFDDNNQVFYNGNISKGGHHVSGGDGKKNYRDAIQYYKDHPAEFRKAMQAYAVHKGMMVLAHSNMDNPAIDHTLGTIFVMRKEHDAAFWSTKVPTKVNSIIPSYPIDSSTSACLNHYGILGKRQLGWKLPIWRITDNFMIGKLSKGEHEICINPINIPYPPMYFGDGSPDWKKCMDTYNSNKEIQKIDQKLGAKDEK